MGCLQQTFVIGHITQLVEYQAENLKVIGSNPIVPNMIKHPEFGAWGCKGWPSALQAENQMGSIPIGSIL